MPLSVGGGFALQTGELGYIEVRTGNNGNFTAAENMAKGFSHTGFSGFVFADAKFAELAIGFMGGPLKWRTGSLETVGAQTGSITSLDFSLLGKLPIGDKKFTIFPLLGIGYNAVLSAKLNANGKKENIPGTKSSDFSVFRMTAGIGGDVDVGRKMYLRTEFLVYMGFPSKFLKDLAAKTNAEIQGAPEASVYQGKPVGFTFKLAAGYRF